MQNTIYVSLSSALLQRTYKLKTHTQKKCPLTWNLASALVVAFSPSGFLKFLLCRLATAFNVVGTEHIETEHWVLTTLIVQQTLLRKFDSQLLKKTKDKHHKIKRIIKKDQKTSDHIASINNRGFYQGSQEHFLSYMVSSLSTKACCVVILAGHVDSLQSMSVK